MQKEAGRLSVRADACAPANVQMYIFKLAHFNANTRFMCRLSYQGEQTHCNMLHHLQSRCQQAVTEADICSSPQDVKTPAHTRAHVSADCSQHAAHATTLKSLYIQKPLNRLLHSPLCLFILLKWTHFPHVLVFL